MRLIVSLEKSMAIQLLPAANYDDDGGGNGKSKILTAVVDAGWIFEIESLPCNAIPTNSAGAS